METPSGPPPVIGARESCEEARVASRRIEIRFARRSSGHVEPGDAVTGAQFHEFLSLVGDGRAHDRFSRRD